MNTNTMKRTGTVPAASARRIPAAPNTPPNLSSLPLLTPDWELHLLNESLSTLDKNGNAVQKKYTVTNPPIDQTPLEDMPFQVTLDVINEIDPAEAAYIAGEYKLTQALGRDVIAVTKNLNARRTARQALALQHNRTIDTKTTESIAAREAAAKPYRAMLVAAEAAVLKAELQAAAAFAEAGAPCELDDIKTDEVLRAKKMSLSTFAGEKQLAYDPQDKKLKKLTFTALYIFVTVGILVGVSYMVHAKLTEGDIKNMPIPLLAAFTVIGTGIVLAMEQACEGLWALVGNQSYLPNPWYKVAALTVTAALLTALILAVEQAVQRLGLMGVQTIYDIFNHMGHAAGAHTVDSITTGAAPLIASLGFTIYGAVRGFRKGRHATVTTILKNLQQRDFMDRDEKQRNNSKVIKALAACASVKSHQKQRDQVKELLADVVRPYDEQRAAIEQTRMSIDGDFTYEEKRQKEEARAHLGSASDNVRKMMLDAMKRHRSLIRRFITTRMSFSTRDICIMVVALSVVLVTWIVIHR